MAELIVLENKQVFSYSLDGHAAWFLGRYAADRRENEICLVSGIVSREHGQLCKIEGQWFYVDNPGNKNGTFRNGVRISRPLTGIRQPVFLENGDVLQVGGPAHSDLGVTMLFVTTPVQGEWTHFTLNDRNITIGSGKSCELIIQGFSLDEKSAKLLNINGQYFLSSCDQAAVYLNGRPIAAPVRLQPGDAVGLKDCHLFFLGTELIYSRIRKKL